MIYYDFKFDQKLKQSFVDHTGWIFYFVSHFWAQTKSLKLIIGLINISSIGLLILKVWIFLSFLKQLFLDMIL